MDFRKLRDYLLAQGYSGRTAEAKIAHDTVLQAIDAAKKSCNSISLEV